MVGRAFAGLGGGTDHWSHASGISQILGLFTATVKYCHKEMYSIKPFTYQILRTASAEDVGLDEILTTILCSGYYWDSGLCYTWGGGKCKKSWSADSDFINGLRENAEWMENLGQTKKNYEDSVQKLAAMQELFFQASKVGKATTRTDHLQTTNQHMANNELPRRCRVI